MKNIRKKKYLVTGGAGFLGRRIVAGLLKKGIDSKNIIIPLIEEYDLREKETCAKVVKGVDVVIHLAANVGGIGYNRENPGSLYYDNITMSTHMMEEARKAGVEKYVAIGTICAYPKHTPIPFKEKNLWDGYPEETNAPYGLAKKMQLVQAQAYRQQYGFNAVFLLPVNLYGPEDNFNSKSSHVIPALILKFVEAKRKKSPKVVVWGSGKPTREFLYVDDAAEGIIKATFKYNKPEPVNLGSSYEISIKELAGLIKKLVGYEGKIVYDRTKPDGQPRRKLNTKRAEKEFGFKSKTTFKKGLENTITWYTREVSS